MIRILEKNVADKIAAGEVVDRPLSVVKELVENALDAKADTITVEIKKGGKEYIRITDNGIGIPADEVELAFMRHATSKITSDKDLMQIKTLGFRGEALASIAAVSRVEFLTKTKEQKSGVLATFEGGHKAEIKAFGAPDGTTITISDLFFNTPARLKFMKSDTAESSLIIDFISKTALAYPEVKFRLINNGNILFSTNGSGDTYRNIIDIYSSEIGRELVPVEKFTENAQIKGYVSNPSFSRNSRKNQIFFVNGRWIKSKVIEKGIKEAYASRLFDGRFPVAFLFINIAPEKLDVNIHPNKLEIRFDDETEVVNLVQAAIYEALTVKEAIPQIRADKLFKVKDDKETTDDHSVQLAVQEEQIAVQPQSDQTKVAAVSELPVAAACADEPLTGTIEVQETREDIKNLLSTLRQEQDNKSLNLKEEAVPYRGQADQQSPVKKPFAFANLNPLGTAFGTYIIVSSADTLYFFDQHAAHERVFFERLSKQYAAQEKLMQPLLMPMLVHVSHTEKSAEKQWLSDLQNMGFDIEEFGPKSYSVRAIPMFMELKEAEEFLQNFIEHAGEVKGIIDKNAIEKLAMAACKKAVKANDKLSYEEAKALFHQLAACENPYSCPHGRPTFIQITKYEIEKLFKRS